MYVNQKLIAILIETPTVMSLVSFFLFPYITNNDKSFPYHRTQDWYNHASGGPSINNTAAVFQAMSQHTQTLFGLMKDEARNLVKNIKDTSNRVISKVQK